MKLLITLCAIAILICGACAWDEEWIRDLPKTASPHQHWWVGSYHARYGRYGHPAVANNRRSDESDVKARSASAYPRSLMQRQHSPFPGLAADGVYCQHGDKVRQWADPTGGLTGEARRKFLENNPIHVMGDSETEREPGFLPDCKDLDLEGLCDVATGDCTQPTKKRFGGSRRASVDDLGWRRFLHMHDEDIAFGLAGHGDWDEVDAATKLAWHEDFEVLRLFESARLHHPTEQQRRNELESWMGLVGAEDQEEFWDMRRRWRSMHTRVSGCTGNRAVTALNVGNYPDHHAWQFFITQACLAVPSHRDDCPPICASFLNGDSDDRDDCINGVEEIAFNNSWVCKAPVQADSSDDPLIGYEEHCNASTSATETGISGGLNAKYFFPTNDGKFQSHTGSASEWRPASVDDNHMVQLFARKCHFGDSDANENQEVPSLTDADAPGVWSAGSNRWCFLFDQGTNEPKVGQSNPGWKFRGWPGHLLGQTENPLHYPTTITNQAIWVTGQKSDSQCATEDWEGGFDDATNTIYVAKYYSDWGGTYCFALPLWKQGDVVDGQTLASGDSAIGTFKLGGYAPKRGIQPQLLENSYGSGEYKPPLSSKVYDNKFTWLEPVSWDLPKLSTRHLAAAVGEAAGDIAGINCRAARCVVGDDLNTCRVGSVVLKECGGSPDINWNSQTSSQKANGGLERCMDTAKHPDDSSCYAIINRWTGYCIVNTTQAHAHDPDLNENADWDTSLGYNCQKFFCDYSSSPPADPPSDPDEYPFCMPSKNGWYTQSAISRSC